MTLLNPIWLWALGGLAIPVGIHLLSRKEGKTIRIGSIRFLAETATSKFSSIRLNEIALLVARCLLIALIVLFLGSLMLSSKNNDPTQKWVVVEKGLENNPQIKNILDSLVNDQYELRRLTSGFPLPENDTTTQSPDYYKLSEELAQLNNTETIVIAGNSLLNFRGKRISLSDHVTWLSYPMSPTQVSSLDSLVSSDTVYVTIVYEKEFEYDKKIILAALQALQTGTSARILVKETDPNNFKNTQTDWLIWLSLKEIKFEGNFLRIKEDGIDNLLVQESRNGWVLTKRLNVENSVDHHLTVQLMDMLFNEKLKEEIQKHDSRTVPDELAWSVDHKTFADDQVKAGQPFDKALMILIVLIFIVERILAFYRKQ